MEPRRFVWMICLASLAFLLTLSVVPTASADSPSYTPCGPIDGGGEGGASLENPGGAVGGDGGDADEYFLSEPLDRPPAVIADRERILTAEQTCRWDFLRLKVWWILSVLLSGTIH